MGRLTWAWRSGSGIPTRFPSLHSNMTRLATGSSPSGAVSLRNLTRIKGSTGPPQDLRLYIPIRTRQPLLAAREQLFCVMEAYQCSTGESLLFHSGEKSPLANAVTKAWRASVHYHWNLQRLGGPQGHAQGEKPEKRPHGSGSAGDAAIER